MVLQQTGKDAIGDIKYHYKGSGENLVKFSATISELDKAQKSGTVSETEVASADSISELETVRRIDARLLSFKHVFMAMFISLIPAIVYICQPQKLPFW
ncbi:hypothetical protein NC653_011238 [Populus alba x Populus x berolinensis]|uniref:Uncharacterized protein n=1 Tax=Populus alba x Populus x berolinensis TaxID=444605 RepID=A0AAD6W650_9ROSI|nr:hypothetical protein NC653_011238 [Populus alba x Populus x berolinensis]